MRVRSLLLATVTAFVLSAALPLAAQAPAAYQLRTWNAKGQPLGQAWVLGTAAGAIAPRDMLLSAEKAEVAWKAQEWEEIEQILGEDVEGNLVRLALSTAAASPPVAQREGEAGSTLELACPGSDRMPLTSTEERDVPVFGKAWIVNDAHSGSILGCPVLSAEGKWQGMVSWASPFGKPSMIVVPASRAVAVAGAASLSWKDWKARGSATKLRDSLLSESVQDLLRKRYSAARQTLESLREQAPKDGRVWYYHGYAAAMEGDRLAAMNSYEQAVELEPKNVEMHFSLGFTYALQRRMLEARGQVATLQQLDAGAAARLSAIVDAMTERPPDDLPAGTTAPEAQP